MITTTLNIGGHTVRIHDPADTPEAKAAQRKRMERAVEQFWKAKEAGR